MSLDNITQHMAFDENDIEHLLIDKECTLEYFMGILLNGDLSKQLNDKKVLKILKDYSSTQSLKSIVPFLNNNPINTMKCSLVTRNGKEYIRMES